MKHHLINFLFFIFAFQSINAQTIGIGTNTPDQSAILDIKSTNKGILVPRMLKSERNLIKQPANGVLIYQTDSLKGFYYYDGFSWQSLMNKSYSNSASLILYDKNSTEIWKVKIDGSENQKVNIILPLNVAFNIGDGGAYKLTKDNQRLVFQARNTNTGMDQLYSCNIDGSGAALITESSDIQLGSVN
jgi:hypothetical protein